MKDGFGPRAAIRGWRKFDDGAAPFVAGGGTPEDGSAVEVAVLVDGQGCVWSGGVTLEGWMQVRGIPAGSAIAERLTRPFCKWQRQCKKSIKFVGLNFGCVFRYLFRLP